MRRSFKRHVGLNGVYNGDSEFMAGESIMFSGPADKIPAGYLIEDGAAVGRVAYATLFAAIGTTYGAGDGATTFNLPDSRAEVWRGLDMGRGVDVGRAIGSAQAGAIKNLAGGLESVLVRDNVSSGVFKKKNLRNANSYTGGGYYMMQADIELEIPEGDVASEYRMRNIAKIPLIKY